MTSREQQAAAWHTLTREQVEEQLQTGIAGLSDDAARSRMAEYGPNELESGHKVSALRILLEQFQNILLVILIIATVISAFMGHGTETIVIGIIVVFAVGLG